MSLKVAAKGKSDNSSEPFRYTQVRNVDVTFSQCSSYSSKLRSDVPHTDSERWHAAHGCNCDSSPQLTRTATDIILSGRLHTSRMLGCSQRMHTRHSTKTNVGITSSLTTGCKLRRILGNLRHNRRQEMVHRTIQMWSMLTTLHCWLLNQKWGYSNASFWKIFRRTTSFKLSAI